MTEQAFVYATAHRDQLRAASGRGEIRALMRSTLREYGIVVRLHKFHVDRPGESSPMDAFLDSEVRDLGYVAVGATADVERKA